MAKENNSPVRGNRKVVQISTSGDGAGRHLVLALCSDGTIWKQNIPNTGEVRWEKVEGP
jgi:hypothetical protein